MQTLDERIKLAEKHLLNGRRIVGTDCKWSVFQLGKRWGRRKRRGPDLYPEHEYPDRPVRDPSWKYPDSSSICHYFIRRSQIEFLSDCTHALKGQTVPLPELPLQYRTL